MCMLMGAKFDVYNEQKKLSPNKDASQFIGGAVGISVGWNRAHARPSI